MNPGKPSFFVRAPVWLIIPALMILFLLMEIEKRITKAWGS